MASSVVVSHKNFFRQLRDTCKFVETNPSSVLSNEEREVFYKLLVFVESGVFSNSDVTKFICKNWRLETPQLTSLWNELKGKSKSSDTMRKQVLVVGNYLSALFDVDLQTCFDGSNPERIKSINVKINALSDFCVNCSDKFSETIFPEEVSSYQGSDSSFVDISSCKYELEVLKALTRSNIYNLLDSCDQSKLSYLLQCLSSSLIYKEKSAREYSINENKLDILQKLYCVEDVSLSDLVSTFTDSSVEKIGSDTFKMEYVGNGSDGQVSLEERGLEEFKVSPMSDIIMELGVRSGKVTDSSKLRYDELLKALGVNEDQFNKVLNYFIGFLDVNNIKRSNAIVASRIYSSLKKN